MAGKKRTSACPQCQRSMAHGTLHNCPEDVATVAWLTQNLPDPRNPAYIVPQAEFDAMEDCPVSSRLLKKTYGSWRGTAQRFGLQCREGSKGTPAGRSTGGITGVDPTSRAELHRLAQLLHGGRIGPSFSEYRLYAENVSVTNVGLAHRFGNSWPAVLAAAGLPYGTMSDYKLAANARRKQMQQPQNMRNSLDRGDEPISRDYTGIPVLPNPRQLASGGIAWTVR